MTDPALVALDAALDQCRQSYTDSDPESRLTLWAGLRKAERRLAGLVDLVAGTVEDDLSRSDVVPIIPPLAEVLRQCELCGEPAGAGNALCPACELRR